MKKFKAKLEWIWDYYFGYFFYNGNKLHRYFDYMCDKYPDKFEDCVDRDYNKKFGD